MPEISCKATAGPIDVLEAWGRDLAPLREGIAVEWSHLRDPRRRVDWDTFAQFLHNVGRLCTVEELEELGTRLLDEPVWLVARALTRRSLAPERFARVAAVFGTSVFPVIQFEIVGLDERSFALRLAIPRERRGAIEFFHISLGQWRRAMVLLGHPEATIEATFDAHRGEFVIRHDTHRVALGRLRGFARAAMAAPSWLREIYEERRLLGEALDETNRWRRDFHRVLDELQDAVVIHRDGRILYANPALLRALGRADRGLVGRWLADVFPPAEIEAAVRALDRPGSRESSPTIRVTSRDGEALCFDLRQRQDIEFSGEAAELVVARDVTEERRMHERLLHADRMASLGMIAAGIAHEVNNPLGYVLNSLHIMRRELAGAEGELDEERRRQIEELLDVALEGTDRVRAIMSDLNGFSRAETTTATEVDLRRALLSALELAKPQVDEDIEVALELEKVPSVIASESRLVQVFLNLILNAVHALRDKPSGPRRLWLRSRNDEDGRVVAEVEDDGVGIAEEAKPRVFDPFFTTKPAGVGTGLGLAISRDVVTRQGGAIDLISTQGDGTRVLVSFEPVPGAEPVG